jgi:hypothetical protein
MTPTRSAELTRNNGKLRLAASGEIAPAQAAEQVEDGVSAANRHRSPGEPSCALRPSNLSQGFDRRSTKGRQLSKDRLPSIAIERDG